MALPAWYKGQKYECYRCGLTIYANEVCWQDKHRVCKECVDQKVRKEKNDQK